MKTAVVTGASRGLGRETSTELEARGFRVIRAVRRPGNPSEREHALDVSDGVSVTRFAEGLHDERIDVLVNNAGMTMKGFDADVARTTLETNFFGAMRVTDAVLPRIPDGGAVVMVSSGMGELSCVSASLREKLLDPGLTRDALVALIRSFVDDVARGKHEQAGWPSSAYRVSKVALNALTRILARDLAARRIRVNAVCPGWVRTDMGGSQADRTVAQGAASIVATVLDEQATGGFFRDGNRIDW
jgi:carbonyl reductase 1